MSSQRHANATTTPEMREFIQNSELSVADLAKLLNISEATVRKWKQRDSIEDGSHVARKLQTTLTPIQETVVVELRIFLRLSLDQLLQVAREYINPKASRSGLARCLKRHGVSRLSEVDDMVSSGERSDFVHLNIVPIDSAETLHPAVNSDDLAQTLSSNSSPMQADQVVQVESKALPGTEEGDGKYLFVARDPESQWVYVDVYDDGPEQAAERYMKYALSHAPFHIRRLLAGNFSEFKKRYRLSSEMASGDLVGHLRDTKLDDGSPDLEHD